MEKKISIRIKIILLLLGILAIVLLGCTAQMTLSNSISFPDNPDGVSAPLAITMEEEKILSNEVSQMRSVSLTFAENNYLFSTDYSNLSYIEFEKENLWKTVHPPKGYQDVNNNENLRLLKEEKSKIWNPTGLWYNTHTKKLYIANYNGHNVLIGEVDESDTFCVSVEISIEEMISPENVVTNADGSIIAVADYDGNALFVFDNQGKLIWKAEVPLAHGVAMDEEECVYVSSLERRMILKYSKNGELLAEAGCQGQEGVNAYLWPTSIYSYQDSILISDTHTGMITELDKDLNYRSAIGGLGPSIDTLHFPYSIVVHDKHLFIADTFADRILELNLSGEMLLSNDFRNESNIPNGVLLRQYEKTPYSYGVLDEIPSYILDSALPSDSIIVSGYSGIYAFDLEGKMLGQYLISDYACNASEFSGLPFLEQMYITWAIPHIYKGDLYYLIGSPEIKDIYYCYNVNKNIFFVSFYSSEAPIWVVNGEVYFNGDKNEVLNNICGFSDDYQEAYIELLLSGLSSKEAYIEAFIEYYVNYANIKESNVTTELFEEWLGSFFSTEQGKEFWFSLDKTENLQLVVNKYYRSEKSTKYILENILVRMFGKYLNQEEGAVTSTKLSIKGYENPPMMEKDQLDYAIKCNSLVNQSMLYGDSGTHYLGDALTNGIGMCGNFSVYLFRELRRSGIDANVVTLNSYYVDAVHTIVETKIGAKKYVFDPTLGIYYPYSIEELIERPEFVQKTLTAADIDSPYASPEFYRNVYRRLDEDTVIDKNLMLYNEYDIISDVPVIEGYGVDKALDGNRNTYLSQNEVNESCDFSIMFKNPITFYRLAITWPLLECSGGSFKIEYINDKGEWAELVNEVDQDETPYYEKFFYKDITTKQLRFHFDEMNGQMRAIISEIEIYE